MRTRCPQRTRQPVRRSPVEPLSVPAAHATTPSGLPRARSIGIPFGGTSGQWNAITDVPGVGVGYATVIRGTSVATGVTSLRPRGPSSTGDPVTAGFYSQDGNGEMTGSPRSRGHARPTLCGRGAGKTEEAVANALVANTDMAGRDGHRTPALPRDKVGELFRFRHAVS
jgi:L-aminopeptidase/D-esterase-like protein